VTKWEFTPHGVLTILTTYHVNQYPDDGDDLWRIHYSAQQDRDGYLLVVQYKNPGRIGHLYSKRSIGGMTVYWFEARDDITGWIKFITEDFDKCRMDIIECLDGQITNDPKPIKKQPQYIQEYPTNNDPFNWKVQYNYRITQDGKLIA
jgi:hypothetical protein